MPPGKELIILAASIGWVGCLFCLFSSVLSFPHPVFLFLSVLSFFPFLFFDLVCPIISPSCFLFASALSFPLPVFFFCSRLSNHFSFLFFIRVCPTISPSVFFFVLVCPIISPSCFLFSSVLSFPLSSPSLGEGGHSST